MMALAHGQATVRETVFESRFSHIAELAKMGCDASFTPGPGGDLREVVIRGSGGAPLTGADVRGSDLRASAALVLAGLAAEGVTRVEGLRHLDRGYEGLDDKLIGLGAVIRRHPRP
jgi:UDP-N-acetylglucosamine 1-carboxyvinyltransferase